VQLPGTPGGLRFVGDHALVMTSGEGAGIDWVNLKTRKTDHKLSLRGSVANAIDVAIISGDTVPRLAGLSFADSGLEEPQQIAG
jgi:hypothetical protein